MSRMSHMQPKTMKGNHGFSLISILLGIVIIAILSYIVLPNTAVVKAVSEEKTMKAKAALLNVALSNYRADGSMRQALVRWTGKSTDDRYDLLKPFLEYPPESLAKYCIEGYEIKLPEDPRGQVVLLKPDGTALEY